MATYTTSVKNAWATLISSDNGENTIICEEDGSRVSYCISGLRVIVREEGSFGKALLAVDQWNEHADTMDVNGIPTVLVKSFMGTEVSLHELGEDNNTYLQSRVLGIRELQHKGKWYCYRSTFDLNSQFAEALDGCVTS